MGKQGQGGKDAARTKAQAKAKSRTKAAHAPPSAASGGRRDTADDIDRAAARLIALPDTRTAAVPGRGAQPGPRISDVEGQRANALSAAGREHIQRRRDSAPATARRDSAGTPPTPTSALEIGSSHEHAVRQGASSGQRSGSTGSRGRSTDGRSTDGARLSARQPGDVESLAYDSMDDDVESHLAPYDDEVARMSKFRKRGVANQKEIREARNKALRLAQERADIEDPFTFVHRIVWGLRGEPQHWVHSAQQHHANVRNAILWWQQLEGQIGQKKPATALHAAVVGMAASAEGDAFVRTQIGSVQEGRPNWWMYIVASACAAGMFGKEVCTYLLCKHTCIAQMVRHQT